MLVNAYHLPNETVIKTDICIIGAGPAGIVLARELRGQDTSICLLESGGLKADPRIQDLSNASSTGDPFISLQSTRYRQFGGNANVWSIKLKKLLNKEWEFGVRYIPLSDTDFEARDWVPNSGWPFSKADLDPYYAKAQTVAHSGPFDYDPDAWCKDGVQPLPLENTPFETAMFQFGPRSIYYTDYLEELKRSPNVTVYYNATATELETDSGHQIRQVSCTNLSGKQFQIQANVFVLALGGIENARLMLLSQQHSSAGIGNEHDVVGRYFADHPLVGLGFFYPNDVNIFNHTALYDFRHVNGHPVLGHLALNRQVMEQEGLPNAGITLFPRPNVRQQKAIMAFKSLAEEFVATKRLPSNLLSKLTQSVMGLEYVAFASYLAATEGQSLCHGFGRGGWSEYPHNNRRFKCYDLLIQTEQVPDPNNRVTLSRDRDALGCYRAQLHWEWGAANRTKVKRIQELLIKTFQETGLGRLEPKRKDGEPFLGGPAGMAHHIGTTRMHHDPRQGVVDANQRVHSVSNLYITGSSVFPTGGYANPTLTILALSLRLADHLKQHHINPGVPQQAVAHFPSLKIT